MNVVALCSQKGGSGKTTLAGHLAIQAELAGAGPVALVDTDPRPRQSCRMSQRPPAVSLCGAKITASWWGQAILT
jgi:cellulose biosynthesis protein BcsQ